MVQLLARLLPTERSTLPTVVNTSLWLTACLKATTTSRRLMLVLQR